jgi:hypothetical protein
VDPVANPNGPVIVSLDGSALDPAVLSWATDEARDRGTGLHVRVTPAVFAESRAPARTGGRALSHHPAAAPARSFDGRTAAGLADGPAASGPVGAGAVWAPATASLGSDRVTVQVGAEGLRALSDLSARATLLVVGSGPGTQAMVGAARCPVVVLHLPYAGPTGPLRGHVVVGTDTGPASLPALRHAFAHAYRHRLPLAAVHAMPDWPGDLWLADETLKLRLRHYPPALGRLDSQVRAVRGDWPQVPVRRALLAGRALPALLRAARGAALAVVGRAPRCRYLATAVSDGMVDSAVCPVLVVPPR